MDMFSKNNQAEFEKLGFGSNAPHTVRMYGLDSEVAEMLADVYAPRSTFDRNSANHVAESSEFPWFERFLAEMVVSGHNDQARVRKSKNACRNMAIQQAALEYRYEDPTKRKGFIPIRPNRPISQEPGSIQQPRSCGRWNTPRLPGTSTPVPRSPTLGSTIGLLET